MTSATRRRVAAAPLLLVPLLLTACSSAAPPAAPSASAVASAGPASTVASASASTVPSSAASALAVKTGDELCALVPVSAAQAAEQPSPAFAKQSGMTGSYDDPECDYTSADNLSTLMVLVYPAAEVAASSTRSYLNQVDATPIAGLGQGASGSADEVDVDLGGGHTLIVYVPTRFGPPPAGFATTAGLTALAKLFVAKLS